MDIIPVPVIAPPVIDPDVDIVPVPADKLEPVIAPPLIAPDDTFIVVPVIAPPLIELIVEGVPETLLIKVELVKS